MISDAESPASLRIDKWLWFARFFKTRALAAQAVRGGKVHLGGARVKAARDIRVGDRLEITRGLERYEVIVRSLGQRRGPASEAQQLYEETEAGRRRREALLAAAAATRAGEPHFEHKPNKRERRQLEGFRTKSATRT